MTVVKYIELKERLILYQLSDYLINGIGIVYIWKFDIKAKNHIKLV